MLAQELYTHRKYGVSRVKQELSRRGIDRALAEEAAERLDKDDLNRIILLLQTKYRNNLGDEKGIIRTKIPFCASAIRIPTYVRRLRA